MREKNFIEFLESDPSLKKLLEIALPIAKHQQRPLKDIIPKVFEEYRLYTSEVLEVTNTQ